jgi:hypothetical protein
MKRSLAILVVIAFVAALSSAAVFQPTKDTFLRYDGSTGTCFVTPTYYGQGVYTYGGQAYGRAGKGYNQDRFVMDFDRAAVLADLSAQLGHTATPADFGPGACVLTVYLKAVAPAAGGTWTAQQYWPGYFTSTTTWSNENRASWSYVDGTDANNPIDVANTTAWNGLVNQSALGQVPRGDAIPGTTGCVRDCPWYVDTTVAPVMWSSTEVYQPFTFTAAEAVGYLFNPLNAYVSMCVAGDVTGQSQYAVPGNNGSVYSRQGGVGNEPLLNIAIPEPMTLSLLAAGALALIRRRK